MLFMWLLLLLMLLFIAGYYNTHVVDWFRWARYLSYMTYTLMLVSYIEFADGTPYELILKYVCLGKNVLY